MGCSWDIRFVDWIQKVKWNINCFHRLKSSRKQLRYFGKSMWWRRGNNFKKKLFQDKKRINCCSLWDHHSWNIAYFGFRSLLRIHLSYESSFIWRNLAMSFLFDQTLELVWGNRSQYGHLVPEPSVFPAEPHQITFFAEKGVLYCGCYKCWKLREGSDSHFFMHFCNHFTIILMVFFPNFIEFGEGFWFFCLNFFWRKWYRNLNECLWILIFYRIRQKLLKYMIILKVFLAVIHFIHYLLCFMFFGFHSGFRSDFRQFKIDFSPIAHCYPEHCSSS